MKFQIIKDLKKAIVLLVVVFSVVSCSMDDIYSCNKDANQWVKSNLTEIRQMSSANFLEIGDIVYMRAAFNAFTPNQRQTLWIEKLENVLKLDWTEQENHHIQSMLELIKDNLFFFSNERDQEELDKVEVELYKWTEYAQEELDWDKTLLYAIVGTPEVLSTDKTIKTSASNLSSPLKLKSLSEEEGYRIKCSCSTNSDWCGIYSFCYELLCDEELNGPIGCGTIWLYKCNGLCFG